VLRDKLLSTKIALRFLTFTKHYTLDMRTGFILISLVLLSGCAADMSARLSDVRGAYDAGQYGVGADKFAGTRDIASQNNLELLITGDALFHENKFDESDQAFEELKKRNPKTTGFDATREAAGLLAGQMANSYRPYMMDMLFVYYYQILDAIGAGRGADARVLINQSYDTQQAMSREYAKLIESNQKSETGEIATRLRAENEQWAAFRDIMNPALTWLGGIYFLNAGKFSDAKTYLGRANGMMPDNEFIKRDLTDAQNKTIPKNTAWVLIETGFAPKLAEKRIDIPWVTGRGMTVISLATTEPIFWANGGVPDGAELLADVDKLFMTEYGEYRVNDALRAWAATVSRAVLQSAANNSNSKNSPWMGLLANVYSIATTGADIRTWATLPKNIYLMRMDKNNSGLIELKSGASLDISIDAGASGNNLIYVRMSGHGAPDIKNMKLK
jgi:hypothetical protein